MRLDTKVAVLFWRFGPYHQTRLAAAGEILQVFGIEACGMEDTYAWEKTKTSGSFIRMTLTDRQANTRQWKQELISKMQSALADLKPAVVAVPGWASADALSALSWCGRTNTPAVLMSESTEWDERRVQWKEWMKSRIVRHCSAALVGGRPHADYAEQLGMEPDRIFQGYDIVDNDYFSQKADEAKREDSKAGTRKIRDLHGLPDNYFLASARFVEKKNLSRLIEAYALYTRKKASGGAWKLVILGDGPLKPHLLKQINDLGIQGFVLLPGFKQYDRLPVYYGLAGAFIHASTAEQWGLVVNEAMASGLPVLVSNRCGCAADLVQENRNGFTFDPHNVGQMAELMLRISDPGFQSSTFGSESRRILANWGPKRFADGLRQAVETAIAKPRRKSGIFDRLLLQSLLAR